MSTEPNPYIVAATVLSRDNESVKIIEQLQKYSTVYFSDKSDSPAKDHLVKDWRNILKVETSSHNEIDVILLVLKSDGHLIAAVQPICQPSDIRSLQDFIDKCIDRFPAKPPNYDTKVECHLLDALNLNLGIEQDLKAVGLFHMSDRLAEVNKILEKVLHWDIPEILIKD